MTYGDGEVRAHVRIAWDICEAVGIGADFNQGVTYGSLGVSLVKSLKYEDEYLKYMSEGLWNIVLNDRSLIQFKFDASDPRNHLSYTYYENPFILLSFAEYVRLQREQLADQTLPEELFREDYDSYLMSPDSVKDHVTPIRYDYSPGLHTAGNHPASHVHFGHQSSIRVGTGRILRPSSFVCFVARQCYPNEWLAFVQNDPSAAEQHCQQVHTALENVPAGYLTPLDLQETGLDLPRGVPAASAPTSKKGRAGQGKK